MTHYKPGDVLLVNFPFTDLSGTKQRPVLVISQEWYNRKKMDVILAAITSNVPSRLAPDDCLLTVDEQRQAGLPRRSMIKLGKLVTLDQRLIRKKLGSLPASTLGKLRLILLNLHF